MGPICGKILRGILIVAFKAGRLEGCGCGGCACAGGGISFIGIRSIFALLESHAAFA